MLLEGKKVLITGAGGAIGTGLALGFAQEGADVVLHYRSSAGSVNESIEKIKAMGRNAFALQADISDAQQALALVPKAAELHGGAVDIVINNAIYGPQIPVLDLSLEEVNTTFDTNARGYFLVAQAAGRQMVAQKSRGWIVNISSISSRYVTSTYVHYAASKGAVEAMTRGMAVALAPHGINVNCVAPGVVNTKTVKNMFEDPRNADPVISRTPSHHLTEIEDCVGPVIFLCTEAARAITGQVLDVDGGYGIQGMEWVLSDEMIDFRNALEAGGADAIGKPE